MAFRDHLLDCLTSCPTAVGLVPYCNSAMCRDEVWKSGGLTFCEKRIRNLTLWRHGDGKLTGSFHLLFPLLVLKGIYHYWKSFYVFWGVNKWIYHKVSFPPSRFVAVPRRAWQLSIHPWKQLLTLCCGSKTGKIACPGKWKHGLRPAVPTCGLMLTHTHTSSRAPSALAMFFFAYN